MSGLHSRQSVADGIHGIVAIEVANEAARLAYSYVATDEGRVVRQGDDDSLWVVIDPTGPTFSALGGSVTSTAPADVDAAAAAVGVSTESARADHKHDVSTGSAGTIQVGDTAAEGTANSLARSDHRHALSAGTPSSTGTANAEGSASTVARSDHVHALSAHATSHQHGGSDEIALRTLRGSQTLAISAGAVAVDGSAGLECALTVTAACTISNPTNLTAGDRFRITLTQDGTGGWPVDWGSAYSPKPAVLTRAGLVTEHEFRWDGSVARLISPDEVWYTLGSDTSESAGSGTAVTGSDFVPVNGAIYEWETPAWCETASNGTGPQPGADPGTGNTGSVIAIGRSSVGVGVFLIRDLAAGLPLYLPQLSQGDAATPQQVMVSGRLVGGGSAAAFKLWLKTEVPTSQVTMKSSTPIYWRRIA